MSTQYTFTDPAKLYADIDPRSQDAKEPGLDAELTRRPRWGRTRTSAATA